MNDERRYALRAARIRWEQAIAEEVQAERRAKEHRSYSIQFALEHGRDVAARDPFRRAS